MKVAISSTGKNLESEVDARFGRCNYFLIVNIEDKKIKSVKVINNTAVSQIGGAGFAVAKMLSDEKIGLVIAGSFGGNMESALNERGIKFEEFSGSINEAVKKFS